MRDRWLFCGWLFVGALASLSLLTMLSVGIFLAPVGAAAALFLATRRDPSAGLPGLLSGVGVPLLYVAYLNRGGPGTVCSATRSGQSCVEEWDPWWWLGAGLCAGACGIVLFVVLQRRRAPGRSTEEGAGPGRRTRPAA